MIDEAFYKRLDNWRRAYGDRRTNSVSITYVFCQYLKATIDRLPETEEDRISREKKELAYKDDPALLPAIDQKDADFINSVWQKMPDHIEYFPVKKAIKILVFGTYWDYEKFRRTKRISNKEELHWREFFLRKFKERIETEENITRQLKYLSYNDPIDN